VGSVVRIVAHTVHLSHAVTVASWATISADPSDPRARFEAGPESWIFEYCYLNPTRPITLGRNVGVGGGSYMFTHGYWLSRLDGYPVSYGSIDIEDDVWLPWACFIMPGVTIGRGAVVGARSLVTQSIPPGALAAGSPAKILREHVAKPVSLEEKNQMLLDATMEFGTLRGRQVRVTESAEWQIIQIDDEPLASIARLRRPSACPVLGTHDICVVHESFDLMAALHPRVFSLQNYQCCPYEQLGASQRAWLRHLRTIGVRYYPIDEGRVTERWRAPESVDQSDGRPLQHLN
jgi:acetyltransferase-like isoleucine patch superfamily enzyme